MHTSPILVCAALFLVACSPSDSPSSGVETADFAREPAQFWISTTAGAPLGAPDLAVARAAEAAVLQEIKMNLRPQDSALVLGVLAGRCPQSDAPATKRSGHFMCGMRDNSPASTVYTRYYAARAHRQAEERRAESIARAREYSSINIVVALGALPSGDQALVLRRPATAPLDVIVLGSGSTGEALGGALAALDQTRAEFGDRLDAGMTVGVRDSHPTNVDAVFRRQLDDFVTRLRNAPFRVIEGVGNMRAIDIPAIELGAITASTTRQ